MNAQLCDGPLTVKMVGASSSLPITIAEESTGVYCTESNEGSINITVYGGTPEYDYQWAHENVNQNFLVDLPVGSYFVTVTDLNGCSEERTITIVNVDPITDSLDLVKQTSCGTCYMHDGTQSFFYFEDEYIGAIIDITTDLDLGESMMCTDIADSVYDCKGSIGMRRKWCFKTDSLENANVRLFYKQEELKELAIATGYLNEIHLINSGTCYLEVYDFNESNCKEDLPIRYIYQSGFSMTRFNEEEGVWSLEVQGLDDVCVILIAQGTTLPVDFISFDGVTLEKINRLYWETANETNNAGFVIEKSKNGISFDSIGFVNSLNQSTANYSFDDKSPWTGSNFYRLKQIDQDGNFKYSHIIHLLRQSDFDFNVIENPFRNTLFIEVSTNIVIDANISIFAVDGRLVRSVDIQLQDGKRSLDFDMSLQPSGNYMVRFYNKTSNEFLTKKIIKI